MDYTELYQKYTKERVDEILNKLEYKKVDTLPKEESDEHPTLYVFRHGQTHDNINFIFSGWRDSELTELGEQQALELAPKLANKKIDMLFASDLKRAIRTMELAISQNEHARNLPIHKDPRIKERCYGLLEGYNKLELSLWNKQLLTAYRRHFTNVIPEGESVEMVCYRVRNFIEYLIPIMKEEKINVAIACHGNAIRGFRWYFENLPGDQVANLETPLGQDYASYVIK